MNKYVLWPEIMLFYGSMPKQILRHQHPVIQLIIGVEKAFLKKGRDGHWNPCRSLLVAPNIAHECDAADQKLFSLNIDPESAIGGHILEHHLKGQDFISYKERKLEHFDYHKIDRLLEREDHFALHHFIYSFFSEGDILASPQNKDERIQVIRSFIEENLDQQISTQDLCQLVFLSESRLLHLFKEEMGLPIRNYILWVRIKKAIKLMIQGENLTYVAHQAGFYDSPHMSKTFVRTLGINPAEILKNSKFVQVFLPLEA